MRERIEAIGPPPNLGLLTVNALCAAPEVIAPMSMLDPGALQGVAELGATVAALARQDVDVRISMVVRTCSQPSRISHRMIGDALPQLELPVAAQQIPLRAPLRPNSTTHSRSGGLWWQRIPTALGRAPTGG